MKINLPHASHSSHIQHIALQFTNSRLQIKTNGKGKPRSSESFLQPQNGTKLHNSPSSSLWKPLVITVCTWTSAHTDGDNWVFDKIDIITVRLFSLSAAECELFLRLQATAESNEVWVKWCPWVKYRCRSIQQDSARHRYTHTPMKKATITLGGVASKQIHYLWTMNIVYCAQNCCCLSISWQIWFTPLGVHIHGSRILITFAV